MAENAIELNIRERERKLGTLTTGGCGICRTLQHGLWRTGPRRGDWACRACIEGDPAVRAAVEAFYATWDNRRPPSVPRATKARAEP